MKPPKNVGRVEYTGDEWEFHTPNDSNFTTFIILGIQPNTLQPGFTVRDKVITSVTEALDYINVFSQGFELGMSCGAKTKLNQIKSALGIL